MRAHTYFDRQSDTYADGYSRRRGLWHHSFFEGRRRIALDWLDLPAGSVVADVGCGPGVLTAALRARGCRVVALDRSPGMAGEALRGGAVAACADALILPLADDSVDAVVALGLASYVDDLEAMLREFERVVRPGGTVVVSIASSQAPDWWTRSALRAPARWLGFRGLLTSEVQLRTRTRAEVVAAARGAGLTIEASAGHDFTLFPLSRLLPGPSVAVGEALEALRSPRWAYRASEAVVRFRPLSCAARAGDAPESDSKSPTRVVRVIARLNVGGPAVHATLLTDGLRPRYSTVLATGSVGPDEIEATDLLEHYGVTPTRIRGLGRKLHAVDDLRALLALIRLLRRERPEIVHTHTAKAGALGRVAARIARVPVVVHTFHGHVLSGYFGRFGSWLAARIEQCLACLTDRVVAVSEQVGDDLSRVHGVVAPERLSVIPLGLPLERFLDLDGRRGELRAELSIDASAPIVVFLGRMVAVKEPEVALDAWRRVRDSRPDAVLLMVGSGPRKDELETAEDGVRWLGWRRDTDRLLADADLALLTSRNEGTPVALIEAAAAGVPAVATAVGGVAAVVVDGETGLLRPRGDAAGLAAAILELLSDDERRRRMGDAAREHVRDRFSAQRLVRDLDALYSELLAARGLR